jgi:hypothetical protein
LGRQPRKGKDQKTRKPYPNFRELERRTGITWQDLAELEPRLAELLWRARLAGVGCRCWSDVHQAFGPIRNTVVELVGFAGQNHRHPVLGWPGAYDVAYRKLYDAVAGLLPARAGGTDEAPAKQRGQTAGEPCPAEVAPSAAARV